MTVYRLIAAGTIEEKIVALHHEKRELADALLSGTDNVPELSHELLSTLLRGNACPRPERARLRELAHRK